jgi:hypothetical protein|nr:MAG TPA: hypothetical protein [Caudoviricetes sp.]
MAHGALILLDLRVFAIDVFATDRHGAMATTDSDWTIEIPADSL